MAHVKAVFFRSLITKPSLASYGVKGQSTDEKPGFSLRKLGQSRGGGWGAQMRQTGQDLTSP